MTHTTKAMVEVNLRTYSTALLPQIVIEKKKTVEHSGTHTNFNIQYHHAKTGTGQILAASHFILVVISEQILSKN